ncbi:serine/threonine-protein kinase [Streptomyces sp. 6-11-2]|uniref:serine/threonine-protein kinase n=1 Tax=Streptomyces sp. 6-11-2 TaxID=2585753 RepID=UPI00114160E3|nr:serine/threonine-protein kinase [Streptomyces sp. 6-11-2]
MGAGGDLVDGRFQLIEQLGSGGMGTVWRARDSVLQREVALKAVRSDAEVSDVSRERVLREARALARLHHPNVVTIHHIVDTDPHPWLVMELVPGPSLQERLSAGPLTPVEAAGLARQVLSALRAAHAVGIHHRDVKPANVLLRADGTAVLTDFGIAGMRGSTSLTATDELVGSPEYIAPERIRGRDDDPASDLWSLGLLLYVSVEGVSPLRRATTLATLAAVLEEPVPPPVRSGALAPVLRALLVRDPAARPHAERLDAMLARVESGSAPHWEQPTLTASVPPAPALPPGYPPTQVDTPRSALAPGLPRNRKPAVIAVAAAVLAAAAAVTTALVLTLRGPGNDGANSAVGTSPSTASTRPATTAASSPPERTAGASPAPTKDATSGATTDPTGRPTAEATHSAAPAEQPPLPDGRWVAQLYSDPVSAGIADRDKRLATIRRSVPEAEVLRSDSYASLRPGYWVIYVPGPFTDGRSALAFCAARGRTTANACIGRYLSTSAADFPLQCRPPADRPTGRCTRS